MRSTLTAFAIAASLGCAPAAPPAVTPPADVLSDLSDDVAPDAPPAPDTSAPRDAPDVTTLDRPAAPDLPPPRDVAADLAPLDRPDAAAPRGPCVALDPWRRSSPFASSDQVAHPLPSFGLGGWYYVQTMRADGGARRMMAARTQPDGTLGPWQVATDDHGGGPHGFCAITAAGAAYMFRNGHIGRYPLTADGRMTGDVTLLEESVDRAFDGNRYVWDSAAVAGSTLLHLGGFSFVGYTYRTALLRSAVPPRGRFERTSLAHPAARPGHAAAVSPAGADGSYVFTTDAANGRLWSLLVRRDGTLGAWRDHGGAPPGDGNLRGDLVAVDASLVWVRGARVHAALVDASGAVGTWRAMPPLPEAQVDVHWGDGHHEGPAWALTADALFVTGQRTVFGARVRRNVPCAP